MKTKLAELDFNQWSYTISAIRQLSHNRDEFSKATQSLCWARTHKIREEYPEYLEVWHEVSSNMKIEFHYKKRGDGKVETGVIERWG